MDRMERWLGIPPRPWRVVLSVTVPLWIYFALANQLIAVSFRLQDGVSPLGGDLARLGQHAVMCALACVAYRIGWSWRWAPGRQARTLAAHLLTAVCFGLLARPVLRLFEAGPADSLAGLLASDLFGWLRTLVIYATDYVFGLALVSVLRRQLELRAAEGRAATLREEWLKARLDALAMQLSPHFLYNAMNTIISLSRHAPERAEQLLEDFTDLLRETLQTERPATVTLERELELVRRYLAVESARFGDRLTVELNVDGAVMEAQVPSSMLQPLVENAVHHGLASEEGSGQLLIRARPEGDDLSIELENSVSGHGGRRGLGIGLSNVRERLRALYPGAHRLEAGPTATGRWHVRVVIPRHQPEGIPC